MESADVESIDINEISLMQLLEYLTANKENDTKKSNALIYFQNQLRQEIKSFRAKEESAVYIYICDVKERGD